MTPADFLSLREQIEDQFALDHSGYHGARHWARVMENALWIADMTPGVDAHVCRLFALFHDAARLDEGFDPHHGARGAALAKAWRGHAFDCTDAQWAALCRAITYHSDGYLKDSEPSVLACWDADRLDLTRVGVIPDPERLCLDQSRALLEAREVACYLPCIRSDAGQLALLFCGSADHSDVAGVLRTSGVLEFSNAARARASAGSAGWLIPGFLRCGNPSEDCAAAAPWPAKIQQALDHGFDALLSLDTDGRRTAVVWDATQVVPLPAIEVFEPTRQIMRRPSRQAPEPELRF